MVADSLRFQTVFEKGSGLEYIEANGIQFSETRSAGCWTLPSTASIFTGLLPHEHGATSQTRGINKQVPTLAEKLKLKGYKTYQITANIATTDIFGLHRGFDEVYQTWDFVEAKFKYLTQLLVMLGKPRLRKKLFNKDFLMRKMSDDLSASKTWMQYTHEDSFNLARKILAHHETRNEKCFVFINCMETHFPYHVSPTFSCLKDNLKAQVEELLILFKTVNQSFLRTDKLGIDKAGLNLLKDRQRKSWENINKSVDGFIKEQHQNKNNLCVFLGDHGENFGEQNWLYHFSNVNDGGTKVPLFWLTNEENKAIEINSEICLKDIHYQILRAVGDDNSPINLIHQPESSISISESFWYNSNGKTLPKYKFNQFSFIDKKVKYINRNGKWLSATLNNSFNSESAFEPLLNINPIKEIKGNPYKKALLADELNKFLLFSDKIKF